MQLKQLFKRMREFLCGPDIEVGQTWVAKIPDLSAEGGSLPRQMEVLDYGAGRVKVLVRLRLGHQVLHEYEDSLSIQSFRYWYTLQPRLVGF